MNYILSEKEYFELNEYKKAFDEKIEAYGVNGVYHHAHFGPQRTVKIFINKDEAMKLLSDEMNKWKDEYDSLKIERDNLLDAINKSKSTCKNWFQ